MEQLSRMPTWLPVSVAAFMGFYCLWYAVTAVAELMAPQWTARLGPANYDTFRSSCTVLGHASVVGVATSYYAWTAMEDGVLTADGLVRPVGDSRLSSLCVAFSNGYMLYDLISMIRLGLYHFPPVFPVHLHHVVVSFCFSLALMSDEEGNGTHFSTALALCLVCELNTAVMALHKIVRLVGLDIAKSPLAWFLDALFVVTFVFTRTILHTWIAYKIWVLRAQWTPGYTFYLAFGGTLAIIVLNLIMFKDFTLSRVRIYGGGHSRSDKKK